MFKITVETETLNYVIFSVLLRNVLKNISDSQTTGSPKHTGGQQHKSYDEKGCGRNWIF
jgi:hypothetical protein